MSCNCNNDNFESSCCEPSDCDPNKEALASELNNFIKEVFGCDDHNTLQKVCNDDGTISWVS